MPKPRSETGTRPKNKQELQERTDKVEKGVRETLTQEARQQREASAQSQKATADRIFMQIGAGEVDSLTRRAADTVKDYGTFRLEPQHVEESSEEDSSSEELAKDAAALKEKNPEAATSTPEEANLRAQWMIASASLVSALVGGSSLAMSIWLYVAAKKEADGRDSGLPPGVSADEIARLVKAWHEKPDAEFWSEAANYVQNNQDTLSLTDEVNLLKVIQSMSLQATWSWQPPAFNSAVTEFVGDISRTKNTADAYRMVTNRKYRNDAAPNSPPSVLPRRVAAEVLAQAVARFMRVGPAPAA